MGNVFAKNYLRLATILVIFFSFFVKGTYFLDPDFGWRVAAGQIYIKNGIPQTDPFSYTMPDFRWVDHAWLSSLIMGWGHNLFGPKLLAFLFAVIATVSVMVVSNLVKNRLELQYNGFWKLIDTFDIGLICTFSILFLFFGVRAQIFSWFCFSIFLWLTFDKDRFEKMKWSIPALFMIWVNVHGSFLIGLCAYLVLAGTRLLQSQKPSVSYLIILCLSILATFLNPYGAGIWREVLSSVFDFTLSKRIVEWMPALTMANLVMVFYIAYSFSFVWLERRKLEIGLVILYILFLFAALFSRRHLPLWLMVSYPLTLSAVNSFYQRIQKIKFACERYIKLQRFVWIILIIIVGFQFVGDGGKAAVLTEEKFYPKGAVEYIKTNNLQGKMFSDYAWGGYLIWKLPQKKVFIDGRMPSWKDGDGYKAMDEYVSLFEERSLLGGIVEKYEINYVLWPNSPQLSIENNNKTMFTRLGNMFGSGSKNFSVTESLVDMRWKVVYKDRVSILYSRY